MMNKPSSSYSCDAKLINTTLEVLDQFKNSFLYRGDDDDARPPKCLCV